MRFVARLFLGLLVATVAALYVLINHSEMRRDLVCPGHWRERPTDAETAYVQLSEYRFWVKLWNQSDGNAKVQTDKRPMADYVPFVRRIGDGMLAMYSFHDFDHGSGLIGDMRGGYRIANGEIAISFTPNSTFVGKCAS